MEYHSALKRNYAASWRKLEDIILSEVSQSEKVVWFHLYEVSQVVQLTEVWLLGPEGWVQGYSFKQCIYERAFIHWFISPMSAMAWIWAGIRNSTWVFTAASHGLHRKLQLGNNPRYGDVEPRCPNGYFKCYVRCLLLVCFCKMKKFWR